MKNLVLFFLTISTMVLVGCGQPAHAELLPIATASTRPPTTTVTPLQPIPTITPTSSPTPIPVASSGLILDERTVTALDAATKAASSMPGPYSWPENRHCSSYVAEYMRELGFPVNGPFSHENIIYPNPLPWSNVVTQVNWLRENYPGSVYDAPLTDFLAGRLWKQIFPGSIVYLQTAIGHNGYNTYYHVAILLGYHADGNPQFAEFAGIMKTGASTNRSLADMASFYPVLAGGGYDTRPYGETGVYPPPTLMVTWVDPLTLVP